MAAEYSSNAVQTVLAGGSVIFTESPVPCNRGLVYHRDDSGLFRLANRFWRQNLSSYCKRNTNYTVSFHANIAVPDGGTVEAIQLSMAVDGEIDPSSTMIFVPAAVDTYGNVGAEILVTVPWICSCSGISVRNTSTQSILVQNANLVISA